MAISPANDAKGSGDRYEMECVGRVTVFGRLNRGGHRRQREHFGVAGLLPAFEAL